MILSTSATDRGIAAAAAQEDYQVSSDQRDHQVSSIQGGSAILVR